MGIRTGMAMLAAGLALGAGAALAAEDPQAPMATADGGAPATAAQIEEYLRTSPAASEPPEGGEEAPRRVRGMIEAGVGTHGYRSLYGEVHAPIGKSGAVSVAVGQTRGELGFGLGCRDRGWVGAHPLGPGPCPGPALRSRPSH